MRKGEENYVERMYEWLKNWGEMRNEEHIELIEMPQFKATKTKTSWEKREIMWVWGSTNTSVVLSLPFEWLKTDIISFFQFFPFFFVFFGKKFFKVPSFLWKITTFCREKTRNLIWIQNCILTFFYIYACIYHHLFILKVYRILQSYHY